jgi:1-acyl-sn-glycerol-3-phosphate acyltransferase
MIYKVARAIVRVYILLFKGLVIEGLEYVPERGSLIVVANHTSYWDPPVIGAILPRKIHFMAKEELFRYPIFRYLILSLGAFPVKRGVADRSAIRKSLAILNKGQVLGIFPEGTRSLSGELGEAQLGAAMLAVKSQSLILPIGIKGVKGRNKLQVSIGKPFSLALDSGKKEDLRGAGRKIMEEIKKLLTA